MKILFKLSILLFGIFAASSTILQAEEAILEAQWEVHQVKFRFVGMSTLYTCDSIETTLKRLLKLIGAREDARAEASCSQGNTPDRFQRVKLAFAIPVPADKTDISREIVPAKWEEVRIVGNQSRYLDIGDCELLEQFERQVLPSLQVRNLKRKVRCIPRQHNYSVSSLRFAALKAVEKTELEPVLGEDKVDKNAKGN